MSVDDVYKLCEFICQKQQNGYVSPVEFNRIAPQAERDYLSYLLGEFATYQPGRAVARVELGQNENILQRLAPFIDPSATLTINGAGASAYPTGHQATVAMFTTALQRIRFVQQDSLYSYINSVIDPVATNQIYLIRSDGFQFYPITLGSALISYVKTPVYMQWGYTLDGNGRPGYSIGASVQPAWHDTDMEQIIVRILSKIGVSLKDGEVSQYAQMVKTQGE